MTAERQEFSAYLYGLQETICGALRAFDPALVVHEDIWERTDHAGDPGGGGRTRALEGQHIECGGVNVNAVHGALEPAFAEKLGGAPDDRLFATGISLILHPRNPRIPTVHMNFRLVAVGDREWVGGGADLTPFYPHREDVLHFHQTWRDATAPWGTHDAWKARCDAYFVNHHRGGEMRGVGGIFYDHVNSGDLTADLEMQRTLSQQFLGSWLPIAQRRRDEPWTAEDEAFMLWRRGRYVEFNLLHDRGTLFGLRTGGRTESILVSLPGRCAFAYRPPIAPGSVHEEMMAWYRPRAWLA